MKTESQGDLKNVDKKEQSKRDERRKEKTTKDTQMLE